MGKKRTEITRVEPWHEFGLSGLTPAEIEFFAL